MSPTTKTLAEQLSFDGPIPTAAAVLAGCALLWVMAWTLRRERSVIGSRNAAIFWCLRAVALLVTFWMLLAPTTIRSELSTTRKSIAVAVDVSRSMQTIDPPGEADDLRWSAAGGQSSGDMTGSVDRALAAITIAEQRLEAASQALRKQQPERTVLELAAAAHAAIERTRVNLDAAAKLIKQQSTGGERGSESQPIEQVLEALDGSDFRRLSSLAEGVADGQDSLGAGWRESLADLQRQVAGIRRRLANAADNAATQTVTANNAAGDQTHAPRLTRVASFLESFNKTTLSHLRNEIDIHYLSFDSSVTPLADQKTLSAAMEQVTTDKPDSNASDGKDGINDDPSATDLAKLLEQLRLDKQQQPLAAAVLLTDAGHNQPASRDPRLAAAEMAGTPVYVVPIGNSRRVRDIDLAAVSAPGVAMKDDDLVVEATLQAFDCNAETCRVELLRDGVVIQHRDVVFESAAATQRVRFNARLDEVGPQRFQVRATPLESELSEENNIDQFEVNVTQSRIDLLLSDEMPRWEHRYLSQLFRRDPKIGCDELLFRPRLVATGRREESRSFPTTADAWDQYDVVLLGDLSTERLSPDAQTSLVEFVRERGGTVVLMAGDSHMPQAYVNQPLADLLPVTKVDGGSLGNSAEGYAFHVTDDGWRHHALMIADSEQSTRTAWDFINRNAPLYWLSEFRRAKPSARTLISAVPRSSLETNPNPAESALLCWQPVGRGRVVYLASPETYRLRFLRGDRLHYRLWGQLLRWAIASDLAAGSQLVSIRTDRPDYRGGENVQVAVRLNEENGTPVVDAAVEAVAIGADDARVTVPLLADESIPGRYIGMFERLPSGIYRVEPAGSEVQRLQQTVGANVGEGAATAASFTVRTPLKRELLDTRSDRALAQQIADATGGQMLPPTAIAEVLGLTDLKPIVTETTESRPLWVQWKFLWIVFGCLFAEWVVRKQMGLS